MDELVTTSFLLATLALGGVFLVLLGGWYVRSRLAGAEQRLTAHVDERLTLVADKLSAVLRDGLDRAERDMAVSAAAIKEALRQVERAEMGQVHLQRGIETLSTGVASLREEIAQARLAGAARHPATVTEIAELRQSVDGLRIRVADLSDRDQLFSAMVRGWGQRGGKA